MKKLFTSYFSRCLNAEYEMISVDNWVLFIHKRQEEGKKRRIKQYYSYFRNRTSRGGLIERFGNARFYLHCKWCFAFGHFIISMEKNWLIQILYYSNCFFFIHSWLLDILDIWTFFLWKIVWPHVFIHEMFTLKIKEKKFTFLFYKNDPLFCNKFSKKKDANKPPVLGMHFMERGKMFWYCMFVIKPKASSVIACSLYFNQFFFI